jgi:hypothetical protein
LCGYFRREVTPTVERPVASVSWTAAYAAWRERRPRLTRYAADREGR